MSSAISEHITNDGMENRFRFNAAYDCFIIIAVLVAVLINCSRVYQCAHYVVFTLWLCISCVIAILVCVFWTRNMSQ